jgi:two-component system cell cycle response regulator
LEIKTHLKLSLNIIQYENKDLSNLEIDNYISANAPKEEFLLLLRASKRITELLDTSIDISSNFYHFEFFKRIIHIEIKRAKRYGIELALLYLTFNNADEIKNSSEKQFESLFNEFNASVTTSLRDIDIPIAFGEEAILLMMPHTNKGGANIVAERIYSKLIKNTQSINFSISIVSPKKEDLNFSIMMKMIHEGIEQSISKGGKSIIVK